LRIIFVGGGTSGHINPALNIADYLRKTEPDSEILYVGAKNGAEKKMAEKSGFNFEGITISGFSRKFNFSSFKKNIGTIFKIFIASGESKKIIKKFMPDVCFGTGGYVCGPFLRQAAKLKVPFVLQEQNAVPGMTTKFLAKRAEKICLGNKEAIKYLPESKCVFTGNPIKSNIFDFLSEKKNNLNPDFIKKEARKILGFKNETVILSCGGSLGSCVINNAVLEIMKCGKYAHIHGYGKNNENFLKIFQQTKIENSRVKIYEYIDNMNVCMAASDLVICRAGAMTLSELSVFGKPAILIPSPNVAENHQFYNAAAFAKEYNASVIEEKKLTNQILKNEIKRLISQNKPEKSSIVCFNSCEKIYNIIKKINNL
jgi:UDP-N-acetylglucosamine--N-acetylmuramyl-(pentapeptide) pyrophosphoryl-undecaprenol N-acetylglucosamine transferase